MSLGGLLTVAIIQLAVLLAPLALGLIGLLSGATAGLASISAWFLVGIPLSYTAIDRRAARRPREEGDPRQLAPVRQGV